MRLHARRKEGKSLRRAELAPGPSAAPPATARRQLQWHEGVAAFFLSLLSILPLDVAVAVAVWGRLPPQLTHERVGYLFKLY